MERRDLAYLILEERQAAKNKNPRIPLPYYLTNINHPALIEIYQNRNKAGGLAMNPPSDIDRIEWELSLFNDAVINSIVKKYTESRGKENE